MASALPDLTKRLLGGHSLSPEEVGVAAGVLASGAGEVAEKEEFLTALAKKGETAEEVAAFAKEFRARAGDPGVGAWASRAIDIVGTGGDHAGGFNISSVVVLVLASAGVVVMKHGNRGITSRCGSADLLAGFGVDLEASPERQRAALEQLGFAFFFAPAYHPSFRHIGPIRKTLAARGQRTVFNILGPLINPGRPAHILLGSFSPDWLVPLSRALETLGTEAGVSVHCVLGPGKGIDELTTAGVNRVQGIGRLRTLAGEWRARDVGLAESPFSDLQGGDLAANLAITEALLAGRGPAGLADTVVWNAAVAMWIVGQTAAVAKGLGPARELLLGGAVRHKLAAVREFYRK